PSIDVDHPVQRLLIHGELSSPINPKPGCRFAARCPYATDQCKQPQTLEELETGHYVSCCRAREIN
ncbi:MAG: peptide ABC transporter ATP-binding protein, partial [Lachnospiraceae bacterium]|nr:peptide ABC transporter ATP-binding protein [Lachnospiraceae bacterium]